MLTALLAMCMGGIPGFSQQLQRATPYYPGQDEMLARYGKAKLLDSLAKTAVYHSNVTPVWDSGGNIFWYSRMLPDSSMEIVSVDPIRKKRGPAFDHSKLAVSLSAATEKNITPGRLAIRIVKLDIRNREFQFYHANELWQASLSDLSVIKPERKDDRGWRGGGNGWTRRSRWMSFSTDSVSPHKKWRAVIRQHNIVLESNLGAPVKNLTTGGNETEFYGNIAWSPDSRYLVAYRIKPWKDSMIHYVKKAVPGSTRGQLLSIPYKQPGDPFTTYEMFVFREENNWQPVKMDTEIIDFFGAPHLHFRPGNERYFLFERVDRGHQRFRILEGDALTGKTRTLYEERSNTFIYESRIFTDYLLPSNEILLSSEQDGWRHLYLLDATTGNIKNRVTSGNWVVKEVDSVDTRKREVWFRAVGRNTGEDPYHVHHYRAGFNGKNLKALNPETGNHSVSYSPDGNYFIDSWSQVNIAPRIVLKRTLDGRKVLDLEHADTSRLKALDIPRPFPFNAKGRDGLTDIWGVVCMPPELDPSKKYPVIENIYAGPQDAFVPKSFMAYSEMQSMAALGFVVVQIDGMGTANRSKAFHDQCWQNLADAGFPDRIRWIKALADSLPWVDNSRVGLYGTSAGGQNSLGGLLFHPEFYSSAVSSCGCHDNRVDKQWWNEQWMGYPVGKHYDEQSNVTNAHKLRGDLLLIVGDEDSNVPPESTYRVADALIKSGKHFEFLSIPGMGHSDGGAYGRLRKRDFFVRTLLKAEPPARNKE